MAEHGTSWVAGANRADTDFPLGNLPYGLFASAQGAPHIGVAIGDRVLDLHAASRTGLLPKIFDEACQARSLNTLMAMAPEAVSALRRYLTEALTAGAAAQRKLEPLLSPQSDVTMLAPVEIGDYTDFYASIHHATNVGSLFRPGNPLLPNYKYVPIGYHGRSSSIVVSGHAVRRPHGQIPAAGNEGVPPTFGRSRQLDYELELGVYIGQGNRLGDRVGLEDAERHLFGVCLLNDWSARDIQRWEYQPLGPFLGKNFATSVSPWVVTMEALASCRVASQAEDPRLPYLEHERDRATGGIDIKLEVWLATAAMRERGMAPVRLSQSNARDLYWTLSQLVAHHTSNGCNLRTGDLLGSGTISGPEKENRGCLLELTWRGQDPVRLPSGETRGFLEDGDEVTLRGHAQAAGGPRIGLGECRGIIGPADIEL